MYKTNKEHLIGATPKRYQNEAELHRLVNQHPELVLLPQWSKKEYVVLFEFPLRGGSADLLFAFEDGQLLLAEVKLSTNREIGKVSGQLLDYASKIRSMGASEVVGRIISHLEKSNTPLKSYLNTNTYVKKVDSYLRQKKIPLAIVSDGFPAGLRGVIGYLHGQLVMKNNLYGIEISRYTVSGDDFLEQRLYLPEDLDFISPKVEFTPQILAEILREGDYLREPEEIESFLMAPPPQNWIHLNLPKSIEFYYRTKKNSLVIVAFDSRYVAIWGRKRCYDAVDSALRDVQGNIQMYPKKETKSDNSKIATISYEGITEKLLHNLFMSLNTYLEKSV